MNFSTTIFRIRTYITYFLRSKGANAIHSPFIFKLYYEAILPIKFYSDFIALEDLRKTLLSNKQEIYVEDFGMGKSQNKKVAEIASKSLSSPKKAQLLFKLIDHFKPQQILELGTSLGLSALYMQKSASRKTQIHTIEGSEAIANIARKNFTDFSAANIQLWQGEINGILSDVLSKIEKLDVVFIDANHQKAALLHYFETILPKCNEETVFIIDDIYWSEDMQDAWQILKNDTRVKISVDIYDFGLLFFRDKQPKQHFVLAN